MLYSGTISICNLIKKIIVTLMGENDKPPIEPVLASNMPLTWVRASFSLDRGGFMWPHRT